MSFLNAKNYLKKFNLDKNIIQFNESTATVKDASLALGCREAEIAKSMAFLVLDTPILIIASGDKKIDNAKFKQTFHTKAKMILPQDLDKLIGHTAGGVCPFGLPDCNVKVYCDVSMQRFGTVFPACGSCNSAIELSCDELFSVACAEKWVDVCVLRN